MSLKLIIFDVDGTLVDSQNIIVAAQHAAFAAFDLEPPSRELSLSIVGLSLAEAFVVLAGPTAPIDGLVEAYKQAFGVLRLDPALAEPLYPGAEECLADLERREQVLLGIATGKTRRGVSHLLRPARLAHAVCHDPDGRCRPFEASPGDDPASDGGGRCCARRYADDRGFKLRMAMARAADVVPIGVSWGFQPVAALARPARRRLSTAIGNLHRPRDFLSGVRMVQ